MSSSLRVVVTGGSGRIGTALSRILLTRGHSVINIDKRQARHPVAGAKFVYADLRFRDQVQRVLDDADVVCHLGEIPHPSAAFAPEELFAINTTIGSVVMQTAADLKLRHAVYTSSCQVYGAWGHPYVPLLTLPIDETHPVQPQNCYSMSKVANEGYSTMLAKQTGLSVSIFRPPSVVGEMDEWWMDRVETYNGPPREYSTFVFADDLAVAYVEAVERALPGLNTYHFSADDIAYARPLAPALAEFMPESPQLPADWPAMKSPILTNRARDLLGWAPTHNFLDSFRKIKGREPLWKGKPQL
jgi:nucleoside-diphosphate-sugar epimerase